MLILIPIKIKIKETNNNNNDKSKTLFYLFFKEKIIINLKGNLNNDSTSLFFKIKIGFIPILVPLTSIQNHTGFKRKLSFQNKNCFHPGLFSFAHNET